MAQVVVNEEPGLTGVASSKDLWVEASHWKSTISLSSSESFACEREGMRTVIQPGRPAELPRQKEGYWGGAYHRQPLLMSVGWLCMIELLYFHGPSVRFANYHPQRGRMLDPSDLSEGYTREATLPSVSATLSDRPTPRF